MPHTEPPYEYGPYRTGYRVVVWPAVVYYLLAGIVQTMFEHARDDAILASGGGRSYEHFLQRLVSELANRELVWKLTPS